MVIFDPYVAAMRVEGATARVNFDRLILFEFIHAYLAFFIFFFFIANIFNIFDPLKIFLFQGFEFVFRVAIFDT